MGSDLLKMVEYSRVEGWIAGGLNSTFFTLIPKSNNPSTFNEFRPIALCNLVYKLISKIIANRIKPKLSEWMTNEQFSFLANRQILDAVGITQEVLHSVKLRKQKALMLKIDLVKAYDQVNWDFLRLMLLQIGLPRIVINWIMACVMSANYFVLINGNPTPFFKSYRGLRQGCQLSPLLFLLVIEGLSRLIVGAKNEGKVKGIHFSKSFSITHLLFVDDVMMFGTNSIEAWVAFSNIILLFCTAVGMQFSQSKSVFVSNLVDSPVMQQILNFLPFKCSNMDEGVKYLVFFLLNLIVMAFMMGSG